MGRRGMVVEVCVSSGKGTPKTPVGRARLVENQGVEGDAHAGAELRQVSLSGRRGLRGRFIGGERQ